MSRTSIYVKNKQYKGSNYYRIIQYTDCIDTTSFKIHSLIPNFLYLSYIKHNQNFFVRKFLMLLTLIISYLHLFFSIVFDLIKKPDSVIIQKGLSRHHIPYIILFLLEKLIKNCNFIWDFDDNILYNKEITSQEFKMYCEYSNTIVVPSSFLRDLLPDYCFNKVILLPTAECKYYLKNQEHLRKVNTIRNVLAKEQINLIWLASSFNHKYIYRILPILEETAQEVSKLYHKELILKIVCDKPIFYKTTYLHIQNITWARDIAFREQIVSHIGLMPLVDTPYTRGKAGFKLVQYLATGLPVIASYVGYNKDHFSDNIGYFIDDSKNLSVWKSSILHLINDQTHWNDFSNNALNFWQQNFNPNFNLNILKELL